MKISFATYAFLFVPASISAGAEDSTAGVEFFEKKVRPILSEHCYGCHAADTKAAGGLRVDDLNGLLHGGESGAAVVKGEAGKSLLIQRVRHGEERRRMPRDSDALSEEQIADLEKWINDGAAWPAEVIPDYIGKDRSKYDELRRNHWSWQPLKKPDVPEAGEEDRGAGEIDRFVSAKLKEKNLRPVAGAAPEVLLRRVSFDLTGLPPSREDLERFLADPSPAAYEREVDRLLASKAFGERWGRHWLDVARYGESTGPSRNIPYPHAWKYRDYVIDAVNRDVPFDRFIQEQVAGDLLPAKDGEERDRLLTATGFLALGVKDVNQRFKVRFQMDNVDEQIDTVTRSVLALTVSCARCHDHKFDPVPTTEYYSLAGIFTSTDDCAGVRNKMGGGGLDYYVPEMLVRLSSEVPEPPAEKVAELQAKLDDAKKEWDAIRGTPEGLKRNARGQPVQRAYRLRYERAQADLFDLTDPAAQGYAVHGVREAEKPADTEVRIRGEAERLGPVVPRGFLKIFDVPGAPEIHADQSGRLELSRWLTSPDNPLAQRVAVNRIWHHLFGRGLVSTVDNFGVTGDSPSHPELLDYLAVRFIEQGGSTKRLVKEILLSRTYRLGSETSPEGIETDPSNRYLWRHSPRRMSAEEIRDSILAVAGTLESEPPAEAAVTKLKMIEMRDNGQEAAMIHQRADEGLHRSVYLPLLRGVTPKSLEAFDPVSQTLVTGQRDETTVPTQALFMLNSSFVRAQALSLAGRLAGDGATPADEKIRRVYRDAYGREPEAGEIERAGFFIRNHALDFEEPVTIATELAAGRSDPERGATDAPVNPDDVPRDDQTSTTTEVQAKDAATAAWMAFVQSVFASAEFRFIR